VASQAIDGFPDDLEIPLDQLAGTSIGCERVKGKTVRVVGYELRCGADVLK
jgi:hypothetical protein